MERNKSDDNIINRMPFSSQKEFNFRQYIEEDDISKTPHDEFNYMSEVYKNFESINSKHRFIHSYFRNVHETALTKLSIITQLKNVILMDSSEASFNYILTEENFKKQDRLALFLDSGDVDKITLMMYSMAIIFEAALTDHTKNIYIMFELPKDEPMFNMCKMALTNVCGEVTLIDKGKISKSRAELDKPVGVKDSSDMKSIARNRKVDELIKEASKKEETKIDDVANKKENDDQREEDFNRKSKQKSKVNYDYADNDESID
jgi:hypothetical protein